MAGWNCHAEYVSTRVYQMAENSRTPPLKKSGCSGIELRSQKDLEMNVKPDTQMFNGL